MYYTFRYFGIEDKGFAAYGKLVSDTIVDYNMATATLELTGDSIELTNRQIVDAIALFVRSIYEYGPSIIDDMCEDVFITPEGGVIY